MHEHRLATALKIARAQARCVGTVRRHGPSWRARAGQVACNCGRTSCGGSGAAPELRRCPLPAGFVSPAVCLRPSATAWEIAHELDQSPEPPRTPNQDTTWSGSAESPEEKNTRRKRRHMAILSVCNVYGPASAITQRKHCPGKSCRSAAGAPGNSTKDVSDAAAAMSHRRR